MAIRPVPNARVHYLDASNDNYLGAIEAASDGTFEHRFPVNPAYQNVKLWIQSQQNPWGDWWFSTTTMQPGSSATADHIDLVTSGAVLRINGQAVGLSYVIPGTGSYEIRGIVLYDDGTGPDGNLAVAAALAGRFAPGTMTAPTGYDAVRSSTSRLPNQLSPTPCVLIFPDSGEFDTGNGTRLGVQKWLVRFYYDQTGDLERGTAALLAWLDVLTDQLRDSVQLGGIVTRATVDGWKSGTLTYAGVDYFGIELAVTTVTTQGWAAVA